MCIFVQILPYLKDDPVASIMSLGALHESEYVLMLTRNGVIKKTPGVLFRNVRSASKAWICAEHCWPAVAALFSQVIFFPVS